MFLLVFELWMLRAFLRETESVPGGSAGGKNHLKSTESIKNCQKGFSCQEELPIWVIQAQLMPVLEFNSLIFPCRSLLT